MKNAIATPIKTIEKCRVCGNPNLVTVVNLGEQSLSGTFPKADEKDPISSPLELVLCAKAASGPSDICSTLQLKHSVDVSQMYGADYGYRSSTSPTMRAHLKSKVDRLLQMAKPKAGDFVLDIGCNDGTLLGNYKGLSLVRTGMDPSSRRFLSEYDPEIKLVCDYFDADRFRANFGDKPCKIVTSIAMFYDLEDPVAFMKGIHSILAKDGVWMFELSYLPLMLSNLTYDQVCHEHLTYLGLKQLEWMAARSGLKILTAVTNEMNGGSIELIAARADSPHPVDNKTLDRFRRLEEGLERLEPYARFKNRIEAHRQEVKNFFSQAKNEHKGVLGYGASTKGNIVLNYCGLTKEDVPAISDLQSTKFGRVTPGTRIPIFDREEARSKNAPYFFVLIWHLRREVIRDEMAFLKNGGKLVFDLPRLHIVDFSNHKQYLEESFDKLGFEI